MTTTDTRRLLVEAVLELTARELGGYSFLSKEDFRHVIDATLNQVERIEERTGHSIDGLLADEAALRELMSEFDIETELDEEFDAYAMEEDSGGGYELDDSPWDEEGGD